jgi:hypothetical protein
VDFFSFLSVPLKTTCLHPPHCRLRSAFSRSLAHFADLNNVNIPRFYRFNIVITQPDPHGPFCLSVNNSEFVELQATNTGPVLRRTSDTPHRHLGVDERRRHHIRSTPQPATRGTTSHRRQHQRGPAQHRGGTRATAWRRPTTDQRRTSGYRPRGSA